MDNLNNTFPNIFSNEKESNEISAEYNFSAIFNVTKVLENSSHNHHKNISNQIPNKKKDSIDIIANADEQFSCENSLIIAEDINNEDKFLKIGNIGVGQNPCIDSIPEVDLFERENDESFLHENNYLFDNFNDNNSLEKLNLSNGSTMEETNINKFRKDFLQFKSTRALKFQNHIINNNTQISKNELIKHFSKKSDKNSFSFYNNKRNNNSNQIPEKNNVNHSSIVEFNNEYKKRGRKKMLLDGIKREIIDKAFLRQFKIYLKEKIVNKSLEIVIEKDKKIFWNEFLQTNNPPFIFSINEKKVVFKSFSQNLLKFIFSHSLIKNLYDTFVKEKESKIINSIFNKKTKRFDEKMLKFYSFYGANIHKIYSTEILCEINMDDLLNLSNILNKYIFINSSDNIVSNFFSDSINTSV